MKFFSYILVLILTGQRVWAGCGQKDQLNYSGTSFEGKDKKSRIQLEASKKPQFSQAIRFDKSALAFVYDYKNKCWKLTDDEGAKCTGDVTSPLPKEGELTNGLNFKKWGNPGMETASIHSQNDPPELIINSVTSDATVATNMTYLKFEPSRDSSTDANMMKVSAIHSGSIVGEYASTSYFDDTKRDKETSCQMINLIGNSYQSTLCGPCSASPLDAAAAPSSDAVAR